VSEGLSVGVFSPKVNLGELSCNLRSDSGTLYTLGAKKVCYNVKILLKDKAILRVSEILQ